MLYDVQAVCGAAHFPKRYRLVCPRSTTRTRLLSSNSSCSPAWVHTILIKDNKNTKDLRIMLKEYLKYRRPHSKDLKNVGVVMQKYLSQD